MTLPIHRWFRFSAGFSARWVEFELGRRGGRDQGLRVLDPFAGSGTTLLACERAHVMAQGVENHPFVARVAQAKLNWRSDAASLSGRAREIVRAATPLPSVGQPDGLMQKIFEPPTLAKLHGIRRALSDFSQGDAVDELLWLALISILRSCSPAGTAQWQYVLPNKRKARVAEPLDAFQQHVRYMVDDMRSMQSEAADSPPGALHVADARDDLGVPDGWADLIITSPPYPNNFDYADATRIELTFLGQVDGWGDLQEKVRRHLIRSCSQHMSGYDAEADLRSDALAPIASELRPVYDELSEVRKTRGGRKSYHAMVVAYFADLAKVWGQLRRATAPGAEVIFVIGDSAPYGVHVPVERWLGELAVAAGFKGYSFEHLRDRNVKWRNRKHRVLLHEGLLRIQA